MLKVGDKVRVIANADRLYDIGIASYNQKNIQGEGIIEEIDIYYDLPIVVGISGYRFHFAETDLELVTGRDAWLKELDTLPIVTDGNIRQFESGATRDTAKGKLDFTRALCPLVLERYVQYLDKHRLQPDGSYREFDNWKKGLPMRESFSSMGRHYTDVWKMIEGYRAYDNHGECNIEDSLSAIIFNASTMLREIIKDKVEKI